MHKNLQVFPREVFASLSQGMSASALADTIGQYINVELKTKQAILAECDINKRLLLVLASMEEEKTINEIEEKINLKVKESIDENQREYYLREKLRAIKEELGDTPSKEDDTDYIREEIQSKPYPQHIKDKIEEELKRYDMMPPASSEANVVRTYIDWVMKTPWYQETEDTQDINEVERILDEDHFGLEKPKERIVEHLAVKQMTQSLNAPIICLVGPPGVGKTSISKSIARALGRKFVIVHPSSNYKDVIYCNSEKFCDIDCKHSNTKYNVIYDDFSKTWLVINEEGYVVIIKQDGTFDKFKLNDEIEVLVKNIRYVKGNIYIPNDGCLWIISVKDQFKCKKMECHKIMTSASRICKVDRNGFTVVTDGKLYVIRRG